MKNLSLEVVGFKRTRLNGSRRIKLTFSEMIQIILGSNGSGKSSLVRECFPLPAEKAAFASDGKKVWIGEDDNGVKYTCTSVFEPSVRHQFIEHAENGDIVHNDWGTTSAQLALVAKVFKITPAIRDIILGKERFTRMNTGKRREWMMRLNNANYDFALAVYKKIKEEANDLTVMLRKTKERLVAEQEKVLNEDDLKRMNKEADQMERELNMLMELRAPVDKPATVFETEQKEQLEQLEALSYQLVRIRMVAPYGSFKDHQTGQDVNCWNRTRPTFGTLLEIEAEINYLKNEVVSRDALLSKALKEHDRLSEQVGILSKTGEEGLTALHTRFKAVHLRKVEFLSTRTLVDVLDGLDRIHPINGMSALESVWDTLTTLSAEIPDNGERIYGQAKIKELNEVLDVKVRERNRLDQNLDKLNTRKVHADQHRGNGETTCPQCRHRWVIGYNENEYERLVKGIEVYAEQLKAIKAEIKDVEEQIAKNYEYGEKYRSFIRLTQAWPVLEPLWDYLIKNEFIVTKARLMMGFVDRFRHDLQIMKDALRLDAELGEISGLIESAEKLGDATLVDVKLAVEQWAHEIETLTHERTLLQRDVSDYQAYYRQMSEGVELGNRIRKMRSDIVNTNKEWIETIRRETILHCIKQLRTALARKEEALLYANQQKARVEEMQAEINDLIIREEAARLVRDQLSPTEGLIAEGLLGFIRHFVGEMNNVIARIWSYPLVVHDCAMESLGGTELDYRFPITVNDQEDQIDDVSEGSTGIQEIIDLSFRISAMNCLGLADAPLVLDEFGASFDKHHQNMATITIANIMEERQFPQLFMVSHYESSYGALTNAEICVLCPNNITIPSHSYHNRHVEME